MEYCVMLNTHYQDKSRGIDRLSHGFLNSQMFGIPCFGSIDKAIRFPSKKAAQAVATRRHIIVTVAEAQRIAARQKIEQGAEYAKF